MFNYAKSTAGKCFVDLSRSQRVVKFLCQVHFIMKGKDFLGTLLIYLNCFVLSKSKIHYCKDNSCGKSCNFVRLEIKDIGKPKYRYDLSVYGKLQNSHRK